MHLALMLAEGKTLWDPTIVGILAPVAGVFLFCGSVYLLLSTNLGARLGFLVAAAALTGFMVLLSTLVAHDAHAAREPEGAHGGVEGGRGRQLVRRLEDRRGAQRSTQTGNALDPKAATTIRSFLDSAFVRVNPPVGVEAAQPTVRAVHQRRRSTSPTTPTRTSTRTRPVAAPATSSGTTRSTRRSRSAPRSSSRCRSASRPRRRSATPSMPRKVAVLVFDYGSIRLPPVCYLIGSIILFILSLLGLHWYELDQRERRARPRS